MAVWLCFYEDILEDFDEGLKRSFMIIKFVFVKKSEI
jgi:hypothetical protein